MELGLTGLISDGICGKLMGTAKMLGKHIQVIKHPVIKHDVFLGACNSLVFWMSRH